MFLYNGKYGVASDDNGLYYMRARYYDISIKRFVNQDVVIGPLDATSSLNRYVYCEGNPVSYLDPFGLWRQDTEEFHKWIDRLTWINLGLTFVDPPVGTVIGIWITSFELGVLFYDVVGDFVNKRYHDVLKDFGHMLLDIVNLFCNRALALNKIDYEKYVDFKSCKKSAIELCDKLRKLRENAKKSDAVNNATFIFEQLYKKAENKYKKLKEVLNNS